MTSIDQQQPSASNDAVGSVQTANPARGLREALMVLAVAAAALSSAIVLVVIPQPMPYASQSPLACSGTGGSHASAASVPVLPLSRVAMAPAETGTTLVCKV